MDVIQKQLILAKKLINTHDTHNSFTYIEDNFWKFLLLLLFRKR